MTIILGLCQVKGGVGKSTIALNLAAEFVRRKKRVKVFDADPSGHASAFGKEEGCPFAVEGHLLEEVDAATVKAWRDKIKGDSLDVAIVDAPGSLSAAFGATLAICDLAIVPAGSTIFDVRGAADTVRLIRQHRKTAKAQRPDVLVVPSRIDRRTTAGKDAVATLTSLTEPVAPAITYRAAVADCFGLGECVPADSPSAAEFAALADAVLTRLGEVE